MVSGGRKSSPPRELRQDDSFTASPDLTAPGVFGFDTSEDAPTDRSEPARQADVPDLGAAPEAADVAAPAEVAAAPEVSAPAEPPKRKRRRRAAGAGDGTPARKHAGPVLAGSIRGAASSMPAVVERTSADPTVKPAAVAEPTPSKASLEPPTVADGATLAEPTAAEAGATTRPSALPSPAIGASTRPASETSPDRLSWPPLAVALAGLAGLIIGGLVALTAIGILGADRGPAPGSENAAVVPASPDARPSDSPLGSAALRETFDDLKIASTLPSPWTFSGSGTAGVIALPTSVDRSVRVRSDGATQATACRPLPGTVAGDLHVEVDIQLDAPVASTTKVIALGSAASEAFSIGVARDGHLIGADNQPVAAGSVLRPGTWAHVSITLHRATSTVDWHVAGADGTSLASDTSSPVRAEAAQTANRVCLLSPAGTPGGSVVINNLVASG
jgi:hypothetical protein